MSKWSKVAIAVGQENAEDLFRLAEKIRKPDEAYYPELDPGSGYHYAVVCWDMIRWYEYIQEIRDLLFWLEKEKHSLIQITEEGDIWQDVETDGSGGSDENFYEILNWDATISIEGTERRHAETKHKMSVERLLSIIKTYAEDDVIASSPDYVYEKLCDSCGCSAEEIVEMGLADSLLQSR